MSGIKRITCVKDNCGTFPMDRALFDKLQRTGDSFTCPAGHQQHFTESTESKLRSELEEVRAKLEWVQDQKGRQEERMGQIWEARTKERKARKFLESRLLEKETGVIEVAPNVYKWSCVCGSRGHKGFDSPAECQSALQSHHERTNCIGYEGLGAVVMHG